MPVSNALREKYHRTARFWPAYREEKGKLSWPALEVAGALVFVYVDGNTLRVSVEGIRRGLGRLRRRREPSKQPE
ncbi:hypothetical protein AB0F92_37810 [Kitasatospora aureofaciens]|uniref:hypothetical protein n=1 Tax=Kitasatospora aureofaciens TaxID=1894 RepID=UPI0033D88AEA